MVDPVSLILGFLLDQLFGDPSAWPHPVRWIGRFTQILELPLRKLLPERLAGILLLVVVAGTVTAAVGALLFFAGEWHPWARIGVETLMIYYGLAARSLARETGAVLAACEAEDWAESRKCLSMIVGRDTTDLPPEQIYRACIETVAESTADGVVAPLFYAALLGPIGMWVYKAINTLDSMVGHQDKRYLRFGWASARADDVANFLPARLTWLLLTVAALLSGHRAGQALRIGWRDGRKHPSPNSGWAEATMAGALGVQLGGPSTYQGELSEKPNLGDADEKLTRAGVGQAIRLMLLTAWLALAFAVPVRYLAAPGLLHAGLVRYDQPPDCERQREDTAAGAR
jgi:adenosylcobinamide-phosphate synthase